MKRILLTTAVFSVLFSGVALADEDCSDPVEKWQSRGQLRHKMIRSGWKVRRIKVDDGCYELDGFDRYGNRVEAKFRPASLKLIELEIEFEEDSDSSAYLR